MKNQTEGRLQKRDIYSVLLGVYKNCNLRGVQRRDYLDSLLVERQLYVHLSQHLRLDYFRNTRTYCKQLRL